MNELTEKEIDYFIDHNRKICWESEFENGEYCIGENKVKELLITVLERLKKETKQ